MSSFRNNRLGLLGEELIFILSCIYKSSMKWPDDRTSKVDMMLSCVDGSYDIHVKTKSGTIYRDGHHYSGFDVRNYTDMMLSPHDARYIMVHPCPRGGCMYSMSKGFMAEKCANNDVYITRSGIITFKIADMTKEATLTSVQHKKTGMVMPYVETIIQHSLLSNMFMFYGNPIKEAIDTIPKVNMYDIVKRRCRIINNDIYLMNDREVEAYYRNNREKVNNIYSDIL